MRQFAYFSCFEDAFCIENIALWLALQNARLVCFSLQNGTSKVTKHCACHKTCDLYFTDLSFFIMFCFLYLSVFFSGLFFSFGSLVLIFPSLIFLFLCVFFLTFSFLNFLVLTFWFFPFRVFTYFSSPFVLSSKLWKLQVSQQNFLWQSPVDWYMHKWLQT